MCFLNLVLDSFIRKNSFAKSSIDSYISCNSLVFFSLHDACTSVSALGIYQSVHVSSLCVCVHLCRGYSSSLRFLHPCERFSLCIQCDSLTVELVFQKVGLGVQCGAESVADGSLPLNFVVPLFTHRGLSGHDR